MKTLTLLFIIGLLYALPTTAQPLNTLDAKRSEVGCNPSLATTLDSIYHEDQYYRLRMDSIRTTYGSPIGIDSADNYFVRPLADPATVDERRARVGLPPLSEYLESFGLTWDAEDYLRKQAEIEAAEARLHQR